MGHDEPRGMIDDIVEDFPAAIVVRDSCERLVLANRKALELLGLSIAQLEGREAYPPDWKAVREDGKPMRPEDRPSVRALRTGQAVKAQVVGIYLPREERWRWLQMDAVPSLPAASGIPDRVSVSIVDVTELRNARTRFQASERRFRGLFENVQDGFAFLEAPADSEAPGSDSRFLAVNPAFEKLTGMEASSLIGKSLAEAFGGSAWAWMEGLSSVAATGKSERFETKAEGRWYEVVAYSPEKGSFACLVRDVTRRMEAEAALRGQKERLELTLSSIGEGVIASDGEGRVILMNPVAERLTGWPRSEAIGRPLSEVFRVLDDSSRAPLPDPLEGARAAGGSPSIGTGTLLSRSGGEGQAVGFTAAALPTEEGERGAVLVFRDEGERRRLDEQIARSQRLESLGTLAGGIAHDFNNLLGGIFGYLDLAKASLEAGKTEKASLFLSNASSVFERARSLTRELLTFSKGGAPDRKRTDVAALARERVAFALSGSKLSASFDISEGDWICELDGAQISQVLENIVINAKEALPSGGSIRVSLSRAQLSDGGRLAAGSYLRLRLSDSGPGVAPEHRSRIFDPFYSTREGHTGLGLATAYSIMSRHGGGIELDPAEPGEGGASFSLYLPLSVADEGTSHVLSSAPGGGRIRVLFVDDEEYLRQIAEMMLTALDCEVVTAPSGEEGLKLMKEARDSGTPFDLAIMDLTIPGGLGGLEALRLVPDADPEILCVATSGYSEDPVMADPARFGFAASLRKPFRQADLERLLSGLGKA